MDNIDTILERFGMIGLQANVNTNSYNYEAPQIVRRERHQHGQPTAILEHGWKPDVRTAWNTARYGISTLYALGCCRLDRLSGVLMSLA